LFRLARSQISCTKCHPIRNARGISVGDTNGLDEQPRLFLHHDGSAFTQSDGDIAPHAYERHCSSLEKSEWAPGLDMTMFLRVFVDDFIQAIAGPSERPSLGAEERWLTRATLHGIHSVFPSPEITQHTGGGDRISLKTLIANDGRFLLDKLILGFAFNGKSSSMRTVGLSHDKATAYISDIRNALDQPQRYISKPEFQKLHGRLNHASQVRRSFSPT
jgi:hypothetical protein